MGWIDVFCPECGRKMFEARTESVLAHFIIVVEQAENCECGARPRVYGVRFE